MMERDEITGRWPRPLVVLAEPGRDRLFLGRVPIEWSGRPPSRTAYTDWLRDSLPGAAE